MFDQIPEHLVPVILTHETHHHKDKREIRNGDCFPGSVLGTRETIYTMVSRVSLGVRKLGLES